MEIPFSESISKVASLAEVKILEKGDHTYCGGVRNHFSVDFFREKPLLLLAPQLLFINAEAA